MVSSQYFPQRVPQHLALLRLIEFDITCHTKTNPLFRGNKKLIDGLKALTTPGGLRDGDMGTTCEVNKKQPFETKLVQNVRL